MNKEYFDNWNKMIPLFDDQETVEVGPDDITIPLPEVIDYQRILNMIGNIYDNYPFSPNGGVDVDISEIKLSKNISEHLMVEDQKSFPTVSFDDIGESWSINITNEERRVGFIVDMLQRKVTGATYFKEENVWKKRENIESPALVLSPILMTLEKNILTNES